MPKTQAKRDLQNQISLLEKDKATLKGEGTENDKRLFNDFIDSLKSILQITDRLYEPNQDGDYPIMTTDTYKELLLSYSKAITQCSTCQTGIKKNSTNRARRNIITNIAPLLLKDFNLLNGLDEKAPGTLPQAVTNARTRVVNITEDELANIGANLSSRVPLTVSDENGVTRTGFFTPETKVSFQQSVDKALESACKNNKSYQDILAKMAKTPQFRLATQSIKTLNSFIHSNRDTWTYYLGLAGYNENEAYDLYHSDDFIEITTQFAKDIYLVNKKFEIFEIAGIADGQNIDKRNSAMSTVAGLLGTPDLLAKAMPMKIAYGGKIVSGTFMETAKGYDYNNELPDSVLYKCTKNSLTGAALKNGADLQVLDYICGNIDRHMGNFFYQLDVSVPGSKLTGIQGIDNDCSFGTITQAQNFMIEPKDMGAISKSMAETVKALDESVLKMALLEYKFSKQEIDAAVQRMKQVKEVIIKSELATKNKDENADIDNIAILDDDAWDNCNIIELPTPSNRLGNILTRLDVAFRKMKNMVQERRMEEIEKEEAKKNNKTLIKIKVNTGVTIEHVNDYNVQQGTTAMEQLFEDLKVVDPKYIHSSTEFRAMKNNLAAFCEISKAMPENPTDKQLVEMEKCYQEIKIKTDAYLNYKGAGESELAKKRVELARKVKLFAEDNIEAFETRRHLQQKAAKTREELSSYSKQMYSSVTNNEESRTVFKLGMKAYDANTRLCEFALKDSLTSQDVEKAREDVAHMLAYEKVLFERQTLTEIPGPMETTFSKKDGLKSFVDTIMKNECFVKMTKNFSPNTIVSILRPAGMKKFNMEFDKESIKLLPKPNINANAANVQKDIEIKQKNNCNDMKIN